MVDGVICSLSSLKGENQLGTSGVFSSPLFSFLTDINPKGVFKTAASGIARDRIAETE